MSHGNEMICQSVTLSGYAEWPKVADAVIEAQTHGSPIGYALPGCTLHLEFHGAFAHTDPPWKTLWKGERGMDWKQLLGSITTSVDEELRLRNAYLVAENRLLRQQINGRVPLTDGDRRALAEIGRKLGRETLAEIATIAAPDTILAWHRTCVDQQSNSSKPSRPVGRPRVDQALEALVIRMARENRSWGYDRIVGAVKNLGYSLSDQTVGNILKRHGIPPAPERKQTMPWGEFIRIHLDVLLATDFFTTEVWNGVRLVLASLLLLFLRLHGHARWVTAITALRKACGMLPKLGWCRPWHAAAERWGCLRRASGWSRLPLGGIGLGRPSLSACATPNRFDRPSQGVGQMRLLSPPSCQQIRDGPMQSHHRRSGRLSHPYREAAWWGCSSMLP